MPKVSVIIPVYGVEEYIERCARSLFGQTLDDIEYIFVDDCSPDNSLQIVNAVLEEYPSRQNNVHIITMNSNSGQAAVRRRGIELATGEYVIHCDSDDYVDREMYRMMYEKAKDGNYDIVVCDFYEGRENQWNRRKGKNSSYSDIVDDILHMMVPSLWNKLIKREITHDNTIVYPKDNMGEDLATTLQYALLAGSVGYIDKPFYFYERRPNSIAGRKDKAAIFEKNRQMVANFNIAIDAIERSGQSKKYKDAIMHEKVWIKNQLLPVMQSLNCTKLWRNTYKEVNFKALLSAVLTPKEKANFIVTLLGLYPLYCKFRH